MLDESMERVVLVKGWKKGASWSFPRGKINKDEKDLDCTIREVWEETGFDIRAAGLVPENERDVKYIDITMREQHMRMFVFRDVPLDTYFEPKTRKEISKIQWYNLRDLPGFVRRNKNEGDHGNTNKFYMVAPFMSHIKKWIGQQRRKDEAVAMTEEQLAVHGLDAHQAIENESEMYAQPAETTLPAMDRSEELKRLLSIGGLGNAPVQQATQQPQMSQANHLLAMLQGGVSSQQNAGPPQTPMDQINAFMPTQPESPHPRHPRQQPVGYQQPPPQFPLSPPRAPQHEQQVNMPFQPNGFGQPHNGVLGSNDMPPQMAQQHFHQLQQHQQNAPMMQHGSAFPHPNGHVTHSQMQHQLPQQTLHQQQHVPVPGQNQLQGQHGAIASGPSAPNASQLPPPRLSAQSMKLLDAFKTGGQKSAQPSFGSGAALRSGSVHQSALLGLLKSSPAPETMQVPQDPRSEHAIVSPAPDEIIQRPAALQERRPTLNEITRSLPINFKAKRPSQHSPAVPTQLSATAPQAPQQVETPEAVSAELSEPKQHVKQQQHAPIAKPQSPANIPKTRASNGSKEPKTRDAQTSSAKQIMQRGSARQTPGNTSREKTASSPSPARQPKTKAKGGEPPAPMTILARPGSSREKSGSPASEASKQTFQPQLLKRHDASDNNAASAESPSDGHDGAANDESNGKRDHLLALFSKKPAASQTPPQEVPAAIISPPAVTSPPAQAPAPTSTHNNNLLNLFNKTAPTQQTSPQPTPAPPSAPALQPTQRPAKPRTPVPPPIMSQPPQNALLDLFKKPSHGHVASPSMDSPISPFNLGSPHAMRYGPGIMNEQPKSRLGSVTSAESRRGSGNAAHPGSGKGSGGATPTEQKDFLLGFLNGVVQKEGQKK